MNKIKVINKGYTLTVTSWENDGDNYNTKSLTVDTIEQAKAYYDLMLLCKSKNRNGVFGNTYDSFSSKQIEIVKDLFKTNLICIEFIKINKLNLDELEDDVDELWCTFTEIVNELLGNSEFMCRVMESCIITYSPEDIYTEEIKF